MKKRERLVKYMRNKSKIKLESKFDEKEGERHRQIYAELNLRSAKM